MRVRRTRREEYLVGKSCSDCGNTDNLTLTWVEKPGPFPTSRIWTYGEEKRQVLLAQCRVICFGCLAVQRNDARRLGHGEGVQGVAGCHCDPCRAKRRQYHRDRYALKKRLKGMQR